MTDNEFPKHPDSEVNGAFINLAGELTTWERVVGGKEGQTVFTLREADGSVYRLANGKPGPPVNEVSDDELMRRVAKRMEREGRTKPLIEHPDPAINRCLFRLVEALCRRERNSGIESVLILRGGDGFVYRAVNGNFNTPLEVPDEHLHLMIQHK